MKKLTEFPDDEVFYRGTIIVLKDAEITPAGPFDKKYALVSQFAGMGNLLLLDIYRSIGGIIGSEIKANVPGHHGVSKAGIREWADQYFKVYYTEEGYKEWSPKIDDILFIEDLSDYFTQANRDLFMP